MGRGSGAAYAVDSLYGCWRWLGRKDRDGYGRTSDGRLAHRALYEDRHGSIQPGVELEHLCRRRDCVRDEHLEQFTRSEQERAKSWAWRCRQTRCRAGHDLGLFAIVTPEKGRVCRACNASDSEAAA
jgi:hypothetical protein